MRDLGPPLPEHPISKRALAGQRIPGEWLVIGSCLLALFAVCGAVLLVALVVNGVG